MFLHRVPQLVEQPTRSFRKLSLQELSLICSLSLARSAPTPGSVLTNGFSAVSSRISPATAALKSKRTLGNARVFGWQLSKQ